MPKRILLIDDEDDIRDVAAFALETGGDCEVLTADGGMAGLMTALAQKPDLILLDVMMPEVDGPSTLARLREREETNAIPVIFLTAKVRASDTEKLVAMGALATIAKPFNPLTLAEEVARLASW